MPIGHLENTYSCGCATKLLHSDARTSGAVLHNVARDVVLMDGFSTTSCDCGGCVVPWRMNVDDQIDLKVCVRVVII